MLEYFSQPSAQTPLVGIIPQIACHIAPMIFGWSIPPTVGEERQSRRPVGNGNFLGTEKPIFRFLVVR